MTSLTKQSLFDACKLDVTSRQVDGWGMVHIRTMTELQRSTRIANMFNDKGDMKPEARIRQRVNIIIDHLSDEKGKPLFNEGDAKDLLSLDAAKLDDLVNKITEIIEGTEEGKEQAE
jgi:hypothetical protein